MNTNKMKIRHWEISLCWLKGLVW